MNRATGHPGRGARDVGSCIGAQARAGFGCRLTGGGGGDALRCGAGGAGADGVQRAREQHLSQAARVRPARRGARASGGAAGDRRRQRRPPLLRLRGLQRVRRLRRRHAAGVRLRPAGPDVRLPRVRAVGSSVLQQVAPNTITYVENTDFAAVTQSDSGDVTANVTAVDLQLGLGEHLDQRLRGRRLRELPGRQHRAPAARHVHLRDQGRERGSARRRRDRDLQPGQHGRRRPPGHPGGHADGQQHQRHPGARHHLRAGRDAVAGRQGCGCGCSPTRCARRCRRPT